MSAGEIHINDTGTLFKMTVTDSNNAAVNIATALATQFTFYKPDSTKLIVAAGFGSDGSDGVIQYATASGDINMKGVWKLQGYVKTDSNSWWYTDIQTFKVFDNLDY